MTSTNTIETTSKNKKKVSNEAEKEINKLPSSI
jgi:hypothetical protein